MPFDYSTIQTEAWSEDDVRATVTDGKPYDYYCKGPYPFDEPHLERENSPSDVLISFIDIPRDDGHWVLSSDMERILTLFAQYDTLTSGS